MSSVSILGIQPTIGGCAVSKLYFLPIVVIYWHWDLLHTNFSSVVTAKRRLSGNSKWACTIFLQWLMLEWFVYHFHVPKLVPCYDVRYDFRIKTMFGSSLPPGVRRRPMSYLRYLCLFVCGGVQHILTI